MKTNILKLAAIMLVVTGGFYSCDRNETNQTGEIFTEDAYVRFSEGSGYLIYIDTGNPGHMHDMIYTPDNLSKTYRVDGLRVKVSYHSTQKI